MKEVPDSVPIQVGWTAARTHIDLKRLSELIAEGDHPFPDSLSTESTFELAAKVREIRKQRLIDLLAKVVAIDLVKSRSHVVGTLRTTFPEET